MMHWPDERWIKLYTRKTAEDVALGWRARCVWPLLLAECNRAGIVQVKPGPRRVRMLAALMRMPERLVASALHELVEDGRLVEADVGFVVPNFIEAQEAVTSDAQRKRDERERRRDLALVGMVTMRDGRSRNVTSGHVSGQKVTPRVDESVVVKESELHSNHQPPPPPVVGSSGLRFEVEGECWGIFQCVREDHGLPLEDVKPKRWASWHAEAVAKFGAEGLADAYCLYLSDQYFAAKGWPTALYLSEGISGPRLRAVRGAADQPNRDWSGIIRSAS